MRDPNRIDDFLLILEEIWRKYPDLRFTQLFLNVFKNPSDYYVEDNTAFKRLREFYGVKDIWE